MKNKLDSLLTKQRNDIIYGQFYGFSFSEKIEMPISVNDKFEQELVIISELTAWRQRGKTCEAVRAGKN